MQHLINTQDESKTLKDLDLVPSASLTLRPKMKSTIVPSLPGAPESALSLGRSVVSGAGGIVLAIWALISGLFGGFFGAAGGRGAQGAGGGSEQRMGAGGDVLGSSGGNARAAGDAYR